MMSLVPWWLVWIGCSTPSRPSAPDLPEADRCGTKRYDGCFVQVDGGTYPIGLDVDAAEASTDALPRTEVSLTPFWMMQSETSVGAYGKCVRAGACATKTVSPNPLLDEVIAAERPPKAAHVPITGIGFDDAQAYCRWRGARLPTEAEWEAAARGKEGRLWSWGEAPGCATRQGQRAGESGPRDLDEACEQAGAVGPSDLPDPTPEGVRGLSGNVWEWTLDGWGTQPLQGQDPRRPAPDGTRVIRGGSWLTPTPRATQAVVRGGMPETAKLLDLGFRCVVGAPQQEGP